MLLSFITWNKKTEKDPGPDTLERDHYHLYLKSIRGEKIQNGFENDRHVTCPSLKNLDTAGRSEKDFLFRNRDYYSMNMIFANEFALDYDQNLYAHFIKKYIYQKVLAWYWLPITLVSLWITLIAVTFIIFVVNKEVINPIQEMSRMTEFMLNPEKSQE